MYTSFENEHSPTVNLTLVQRVVYHVNFSFLFLSFLTELLKSDIEWWFLFPSILFFFFLSLPFYFLYLPVEGWQRLSVAIHFGFDFPGKDKAPVEQKEESELSALKDHPFRHTKGRNGDSLSMLYSVKTCVFSCLCNRYHFCQHTAHALHGPWREWDSGPGWWAVPGGLAGEQGWPRLPHRGVDCSAQLRLRGLH